MAMPSYDSEAPNLFSSSASSSAWIVSWLPRSTSISWKICLKLVICEMRFCVCRSVAMSLSAAALSMALFTKTPVITFRKVKKPMTM